VPDDWRISCRRWLGCTLTICQIWHSISYRPIDEPLVWLRGEVKSPPFSPAAPKQVIMASQRRIRQYDDTVSETEE